LKDFAETQMLAGYRRFVFDLAECRGLDSTFMGCMIGIYKALTREPGEITGRYDPVDSTRAMRKTNVIIPPFPTGTPLPDANEALVPLTPEQAVEELRKLQLGAMDTEATAVKDGFVVAINVSPECHEMLNILGVDNFVPYIGDVNLAHLEATLLSAANISTEERHRLILQAHEHLVEIDERNEAQFGDFLRTLSKELAQKVQEKNSSV
jgi:hypothetical protein